MHFKIQTEKDGRMMNLKGRNFLKLMDFPDRNLNGTELGYELELSETKI